MSRCHSRPHRPRPVLGGSGLAARHGGALAEFMLVDAKRSFRLPDAVPDDLAAFTAPLSVGCHAASLAVLLALKGMGRGAIVSTDLSAERRGGSYHGAPATGHGFCDIL